MILLAISRVQVEKHLNIRGKQWRRRWRKVHAQLLGRTRKRIRCSKKRVQISLTKGRTLGAWKRRIRGSESNREVRARAHTYRYAWEKFTVGNLTYWWRDGKATPGQNDGWKGIPMLASHGDWRLIFMIIRSTGVANCPFLLST